MKRELYRTVSDFLDDPHFRSWVLTGKDEQGWVDWVAAHPARSQTITEARNFLLAMGVSQREVTPEITEDALNSTLERIRNYRKPSLFRYPGLAWKYPAAAVFLLLGAFWYFTPSGEKTPAEHYAEVNAPINRDTIFRNNTLKPSLINLEDGSSVILQPGGEISCSEAFNSRVREVHLSGEAFFEVTKNPEKPFLVYSGDIVTRVVGTSFRIKAIEGHPQIEVFVKTGEVNIRQLVVSDDQSLKEVALYPNESVSFLKERNVFEKLAYSDIPKRAIEYLSFDFIDTPVAEIFKIIEQAYTVSIDYPHKLLENCYLSTSLTDEPLLEKLKIICESLGENSSFTMSNNQIVIKSNGCN